MLLIPTIIPGLVSITFRQLQPQEIIENCVRCGLQSIEWGGDVHVPHGDINRAREVAAMTRDAGLRVAAYGSYYRVGSSEQDGLAFQSVLDAAHALGAPCIRVWPGARGSADADAPYRAWVVDELRRIGDLAESAGIKVVTEYHGGTLTDTDASAVRLLREVDHPNVRTLWQPPNGQSFQDSLHGLRSVLPFVENLHVFYWWPTSADRHPLSEGAERWLPYLRTVFKSCAEASRPQRSFHALLEFVRGGELAQLEADAATLRGWIADLCVEANEI